MEGVTGDGCLIPTLDRMFRTLQEVELLIRGFESGSLPKAQWTHHAHLVAGLWYLQQRSPAEALMVLRQRIRAYNEAVGGVNSDTSGYHETITRLFIWGIDRERRRHPEPEFPAQVTRLLESPLALKEWPLSYYSRERLGSVAARRDWVEPDLRPLESEAI